jgi:hypothetical protein
VYFEVIQHEGIYFSVSGVDLRKMKAGAGQIAGDVAKATRVWAILMGCVGKFFKGFLTTLAAPAQLLIDTGAKAIDMISLYMAAEAKWKFGIDIPHTCISSTCRQYEKCLDDLAPASCKTDLQIGALKEAASLALPMIPLTEQAIQCVSGDCEACGGLSVVFLPTIIKGVTRFKKGPTPREPLAERPKVPEETALPSPRLELTKPSRPAPRPAEEIVAEPPAPKPRKPITQKDAEMDRPSTSRPKAPGQNELDDETHRAAYGEGKEQASTQQRPIPGYEK